MDLIVASGGSHPADVRRILDGLPEWFGVPESNDAYVAAAMTLPNVVARCGDEVVGVCLLKPHNPVSTEIELLAVPRDLHRSGIGRSIVEHVVTEQLAAGVRLLHVKTFGPSGESPEYARTRGFYEGVGFLPLEERTDIWDERNPCLFLVRPI